MTQTDNLLSGSIMLQSHRLGNNTGCQYQQVILRAPELWYNKTTEMALIT